MITTAAATTTAAEAFYGSLERVSKGKSVLVNIINI